MNTTFFLLAVPISAFCYAHAPVTVPIPIPFPVALPRHARGHVPVLKQGFVYAATLAYIRFRVHVHVASLPRPVPTPLPIRGPIHVHRPAPIHLSVSVRNHVPVIFPSPVVSCPMFDPIFFVCVACSCSCSS